MTREAMLSAFWRVCGMMCPIAHGFLGALVSTALGQCSIHMDVISTHFLGHMIFASLHLEQCYVCCTGLSGLDVHDGRSMNIHCTWSASKVGPVVMQAIYNIL